MTIQPDPALTRRIIPSWEAAMMKNFGLTWEEARAVMQARRSKAGKKRNWDRGRDGKFKAEP